MSAAPKILIVYAYYETDDARRNLGFFCKHAVSPYRDRQHVVVVNGACSIEDQIPRLENVRVLKRDNRGFDFGAWAHALREVQVDQFDFFFLLNSSVTGPFMPTYQDSSRWPEMFLSMLSDRVKLAGITINVFRGDPIVQSMFLVTDRVGINLLIRNGIFTNNDGDATKETVIFNREVRASQLVLNEGFHVDSLDLPHMKRALQPLKRDTLGDIIQPGSYYGHTIEPLDSCFFKTNRGCSAGALERSMRLADHKRSTAADRCFQDPRIMRTLEVLKRVPSAWKVYLEFAVWLTNRFLPQIVVDLGVDYGASTYAWGASGVSQVIGIDWFKGDEQTGFRDTHNEVLALGATLARDQRYEDTVRIWRSSFENAAESFDGQIDVLHVDGLHTYKDVKKSVKEWLPKLSKGGLVVLHGVRTFPDSVGKVFAEKLDGAKTLLDYSTGLGIVSKDKQKIEVIDREWKQKLHLHASGLRHADFDNLLMQP
jgi:hypothetical protein